MSQTLLKSEIKKETDIVWVRKKARELSAFLNFDNQTQTRISTAVSEITRNAYQYAQGGTVEFSLTEDQEKIGLKIRIIDRGPGIKNLEAIQKGNYKSETGMGVGLMGAKRLMDDFSIETGPHGTVIMMFKFIPGRKTLLTASEINSLTTILMQAGDYSPIDEIQKQNREILVAISELNDKKEELTKLNLELQDTNRGVLALYAELDEKAVSLKNANEAKTSFLSNMTHEFRSPLNSILGIAAIIQEQARADNAKEREKQINFVISAANSLSEMVNDLLDIAKIEAGKVELKKSHFNVNDLFSTLRGLMRPLIKNENIFLNFEEPELLNNTHLYTDEGKLSQILRNLVSNALKYTESGGVTVSAQPESGGTILIEVKDTGIGIAPENLNMIFDEFVQVDNNLQKKNKGTGLGLSLSRKLAHLLGGEISVQSELEKGSVFSLRILVAPDSGTHFIHEPLQPKSSSKRIEKPKILVVDDDNAMRYTISKALEGLDVFYRDARGVDEGLKVAKEFNPNLIVLDLVMPEKTGHDFILECLGDEHLKTIPIILHTSKILEEDEKEFLQKHTHNIIRKEPEHRVLKETISAIIKH